MADKKTLIDVTNRPWGYDDVEFWRNPEDGTQNAVIEFEGERTRLRAGILIVNGDKVLLSREKGEESEFSIPGGGIDVDETPAEAAVREAQEEVRFNVKNARETGYDYCEIHTEVVPWVKKHVPEKKQWKNYYTCLVIAEYSSSFNGDIDEADIDETMDENKKWYKIKDVIDMPTFKTQWKNALIMNGYCPGVLTEGLNESKYNVAKLRTAMNAAKAKLQSVFTWLDFSQVKLAISYTTHSAGDWMPGTNTLRISAMLSEETDDEINTTIYHEFAHVIADDLIKNHLTLCSTRTASTLNENSKIDWNKLEREFNLHRLCPNAFSNDLFIIGTTNRDDYSVYGDTGELLGASRVQDKAMAISLFNKAVADTDHVEGAPANPFNDRNTIFYKYSEDINEKGHGAVWQKICAIINEKFGVTIEKYYKNPNGLFLNNRACVKFVCSKCGKQWVSSKTSALRPNEHWVHNANGCEGDLRVFDIRNGQEKEIPQAWQQEKEVKDVTDLFDEDLSDKAKEYFGTTYSWKNAIYMSPDGAWLDGSGVKLGSTGYGRCVDHREVSDIFDDAISGDSAMIAYMNEGNIRLKPEAPGFEMIKEPTEEQYASLKKLMSNYRGDYYIDIDDNNGWTMASKEMEAAPRHADMSILWLKDFFANRNAATAREALREDSRSALVSQSRGKGEYKDKSKGKNRFERKKLSKIANAVKQYNKINMDTLFKQDELKVQIPVIGESDTYLVTIKVNGVIAEIAKNIKSNNNKLEYKSIIQALTKVFNTSDVYVNCTCPDHLYNFAHWNIIKNVSTEDTAHDPGPGKGIANPNDDKGRGCKHTLLVLANGDWMLKVASVINNYIHYAESHFKKPFLKIIFPKLYGVLPEDAASVDLLPEDFNFETSSDIIDTINKYGANRGKFEKGSNKNPITGTGGRAKADKGKEAEDSEDDKETDDGEQSKN